MSKSLDQPLLEALLDSWDRNNTILLNLLRAHPDGGLELLSESNQAQRLCIQVRVG